MPAVEEPREPPRAPHQRGEPFAPRPEGEFDTPAEVDATFRTQRRIAVGYLGVFLILVLGVPALNLTLDWWATGRVVGRLSPSFAMAAGGLYLAFGLIAAAATRLTGAVEERMLGGAGAADGSATDGDGAGP